VRFEVYACSDKGCVRTNNEDNIYVDGLIRENVDCPRIEVQQKFNQSRILFAVCDGMGGEANGEYASLAAVKTIHTNESVSIYQEAKNNTAMANAAVKKVQQEFLSRHTGTTLAAFAIDDDIGLAYNLGDSRIYLHRDGLLVQMSKDHTMAEYLVELGIITNEQAAKHPNKNSLTQFLGMDFDGVIEPYFADVITLLAGDTILICSDGLYDMVDDQTIKETIEMYASSAEIGRSLIDKALLAGGLDNVSAIVIKPE
jgi:protein phosphatase